MGFLDNNNPMHKDTIFSNNTFSLYYGLRVEVFRNEELCEGVVFDYNDGCDERSVFFPDLGEEMMFEICVLSRAVDWNEYYKDWRICGVWMFLEVVEEVEKECPLMFGIKKLWLDVQEKKGFKKVGMWKCHDKVLWKNAILDVVKCYFTMNVDHVFDHIDSEHRQLIDSTKNTKNEISTANVTASYNGCKGTGAEFTDVLSTDNSLCTNDEKSKNKLSTVSENRGWLSAENVIVSNPEFCPDVISDYLGVSETLRKKLTEKLRKHLLYEGWKIQYKKEVCITRLRYISPTGKIYMSLVKICEDLNKDSIAMSVLSEDNGNSIPPKDRSSKTLLDRLSDSPEQKMTSCTSNNNVVFEREFCPEAVENWCKYMNSNDSGKRGAETLKAKKHLSAMGWSFFYAFKDTKRELRYLSPRGKVYYSLLKACEDCMKENANVKLPENMAISETKDGYVSNPISVINKSHVKVDSMLGKNHSKRHMKHSSRPAVRVNKRARSTAVYTASQSSTRTVLSWLIDCNVVIPRSRVKYICRKNGKPLKTGKISREGIMCDCCGKIYSLSAFSAHTGSSVSRPSMNLFLDDGRSLMECQRQILNKATEIYIDQNDKRVYSENDELCSICHYEGELMLCDRCPASFHMACLGLKEIPEGDWFCPSCCCAICGLGEMDDAICQDNVLRCCQCEHQYHISCLSKRETRIETDAKGNRFCSVKCKEICSGLNNLLGRPFALDSNNLTWTLVAANKCDSRRLELSDMDTIAENYSKLNVALSIMHECFEPLKDPRTKSDIVEDVIFSRSSRYSRLNYQGFYTVILEKNEEVITAGNVRIFGDKVAEVPLVGTRLQYRRQGMCRILMNELEKKLTELGVERLVLPAVSSVLKTWTGSFGFSPVTKSMRLQFLSYPLQDFQGTIMCHKLLGAQHETESNKITDQELPKNNCTFSHSHQTPLICQMKPEEKNGSEMSQGRGGWNERQRISGMHQEEYEEQTDQQITNMVSDECDQDQFSLVGSISQETPITHQPNLFETRTSHSISSNNLKRKSSCIDISDLKMNKRRASKETINTR